MEVRRAWSLWWNSPKQSRRKTSSGSPTESGRDDALDALHAGILGKQVNWVLDAYSPSVCSAKEVPQHFVDGIGTFDLWQMADAVEDFQFSLRQYLDKDRRVLVNRVHPVLSPGDHQHRKIQLRCHLFGTVSVDHPELYAMHKATRIGGAHDVAHKFDGLRRGAGGEQCVDAGDEGITAIGDLPI